ncbi:hypothetical protein BDV3_007285 [Batrachochytrium dendrobatidis]
MSLSDMRNFFEFVAHCFAIFKVSLTKPAFTPFKLACTSGHPRSALKPRSLQPPSFRFRSESTSGSAPTRPGF